MLCVDFGSTFTKAALVDAGSGTLLGTASPPHHDRHRRPRRVRRVPGPRCERTIPRSTARRCWRARRPAAGSGSPSSATRSWSRPRPDAGSRCRAAARWCTWSPWPPTPDPLPGLLASRPDVVLLVGGTDGGNTEALLAGARMLAGARWATPVVVAGNVDAREDVAGLLAGSATPYVLADNVVPRIGVLAPGSARAAIREMFLAHVIGGKHLSSRADFAAMVRGPTPDLVLTGVEVLAATLAPVTWSWSTSAAPPPTSTPSSTSTRRTPRWDARWSRPRRSRAPSRATWACAGAPSPPSSPAWRPGCSRPTRRWTGRPGCVTTTRRTCPPTRPTRRTTCASRPRPRCSLSAGTRGGRASC